MAGGSFRTELPTMGQAQNHVYEVNRQIQAQLTKLWNELAPLRSSWQGDAAVSFETLHQRWNEGATKLNKALDGIGQTIGANEKNYTTSETTNQTGFTRITAGLQ